MQTPDPISTGTVRPQHLTATTRGVATVGCICGSGS
jgi:hypothetical protein